MNREERIEKARRMAAAQAPQPAAVAHKRAGRIHQRLSDVGAAQAQRHVSAAEQAGNAAYLETGSQRWNQAVELARLVTIRRAKRRDTITYGEIKWAILDELGMLVDDAMFADLAVAVSHDDDRVLLSCLIVSQDDGKPSDDVLLHGLELGFDQPPEILQRQVYERFA